MSRFLNRLRVRRSISFAGALRVALFSPVTAEYPITLLQDHPDALLTATVETATHPVGLHPEWDLGLT